MECSDRDEGRWNQHTAQHTHTHTHNSGRDAVCSAPSDRLLDELAVRAVEEQQARGLSGDVDPKLGRRLRPVASVARVERTDVGGPAQDAQRIFPLC